MALLLKNGKVYSVISHDFVLADVRIQGEFIAEIKSHLVPRSEEQVIDCLGKYILPGLIDAHVHCREPGATHKEDFLTASKAAAAGGVTTILDMPNNNPPTTTQERIGQKQVLAQKSVVNYGFYALGCVENKEILSQLKEIVGVKIYLGSSTGNYLTDDLGVLVELLENSPVVVVVHAENEQLIKYFSRKYKDTKLHHKMRHNLCALTSVAEATTISSYLQKRLHVAHISTKEEVDFLRRFKTPSITCEVCPHHLFLTEQFFLQQQNYGKMNPPLRYQQDQEALWQALREGLIDIIATDHAPHTREEKEQEFFSAPCGVPGVQTMLPLLLDAVVQRKLMLQDVVRLTAVNPARIFNIVLRGQLVPGYYADITVVDLQQKAIIQNEQQYSKCGWTPFAGREVQGWPILTIVNGKIVSEQGVVKEHRGVNSSHQGMNVAFFSVSTGMRTSTQERNDYHV